MHCLFFGDFLRDALIKEEVSPTRLAEIAGVKPSTVLKWLRGESYPSSLSLAKIVLSLRSNQYELFTAAAYRRYDKEFGLEFPGPSVQEVLGLIVGDAAISKRLTSKQLSRLFRIFRDTSREFVVPQRPYKYVDEESLPISELMILPEPEIVLISDWRSVISRINRDHAELYNLSWKKFEDLMAHVLEEHGWKIIPMGYTKDGGIDILAVRKVAPGVEFTMMVQCKKYSHNRKVGVSVTKDVWATKWEKGLHHAMIATTSFFTKGAKKKAVSWHLDMRDHDAIVELCKEYGNIVEK